jgi:hypothetical protein
MLIDVFVVVAVALHAISATASKFYYIFVTTLPTADQTLFRGYDFVFFLIFNGMNTLHAALLVLVAGNRGYLCSVHMTY